MDIYENLCLDDVISLNLKEINIMKIYKIYEIS